MSALRSSFSISRNADSSESRTSESQHTRRIPDGRSSIPSRVFPMNMLSLFITLRYTALTVPPSWSPFSKTSNIESPQKSSIVLRTDLKTLSAFSSSRRR